MRYVIIKKLDDTEPVDIAKLIFKAIFEELVFEPRIGIGTDIDNFLNLKESFDKAAMALELVVFTITQVKSLIIRV